MTFKNLIEDVTRFIHENFATLKGKDKKAIEKAYIASRGKNYKQLPDAITLVMINFGG